MADLADTDEGPTSQDNADQTMTDNDPHNSVGVSDYAGAEITNEAADIIPTNTTRLDETSLDNASLDEMSSYKSLKKSNNANALEAHEDGTNQDKSGQDCQINTSQNSAPDTNLFLSDPYENTEVWFRAITRLMENSPTPEFIPRLLRFFRHCDPVKFGALPIEQVRYFLQRLIHYTGHSQAHLAYTHVFAALAALLDKAYVKQGVAVKEEEEEDKSMGKQGNEANDGTEDKDKHNGKEKAKGKGKEKDRGKEKDETKGMASLHNHYGLTSAHSTMVSRAHASGCLEPALAVLASASSRLHSQLMLSRADAVRYFHLAGTILSAAGDYAAATQHLSTALVLSVRSRLPVKPSQLADQADMFEHWMEANLSSHQNTLKGASGLTLPTLVPVELAERLYNDIESRGPYHKLLELMHIQFPAEELDGMLLGMADQPEFVRLVHRCVGRTHWDQLQLMGQVYVTSAPLSENATLSRSVVERLVLSRDVPLGMRLHHGPQKHQDYVSFESTSQSMDMGTLYDDLALATGRLAELVSVKECLVNDHQLASELHGTFGLAISTSGQSITMLDGDDARAFARGSRRRRSVRGGLQRMSPRKGPLPVRVDVRPVEPDDYGMDENPSDESMSDD